MTTRSMTVLSATPRASFNVVLREAWARMDAMIKARTTRRLLAEMEPHMLADIGVSRGDAAYEAARPFWDIAAHR